MKQAKASVDEAKRLLRWLQTQEEMGRDPPHFNRTVHGYLLMLEHCADPEKDFIDFKPGTSPDEIEALRKRAEAAERVRELEAKNARLRAALEDVSLLAHCISKAGPLNTPDLETAWRKFDLISVKAAEALVDRKAALNSEEAST